MTTPLTKPLKRELQIQGRPFVVTLTAEGIKLTLKGKRKGQELRWEDLVTGEAALAAALNASLKDIPASQSAAHEVAHVAEPEESVEPSNSRRPTVSRRRAPARSSKARSKRAR